MQIPKLLSIQDTANLLNISPVTVIRLFDSGLLSGVLIAQRKRKRIIKFRPEAVEKFVARREQRVGRG